MNILEPAIVVERQAELAAKTPVAVTPVNPGYPVQPPFKTIPGYNTGDPLSDRLEIPRNNYRVNNFTLAANAERTFDVSGSGLLIQTYSVGADATDWHLRIWLDDNPEYIVLDPFDNRGSDSTLVSYRNMKSSVRLVLNGVSFSKIRIQRFGGGGVATPMQVVSWSNAVDIRYF